MPKDKKLQVLEVIKKEVLPKGRKGRHATTAYQVEDGERASDVAYFLDILSAFSHPRKSEKRLYIGESVKESEFTIIKWKVEIMHVAC